MHFDLIGYTESKKPKLQTSLVAFCQKKLASTSHDKVLRVHNPQCTENTFVKSTMRNWRKAHEKFISHGGSGTHMCAVQFWREYWVTGETLANKISPVLEVRVKKICHLGPEMDWDGLSMQCDCEVTMKASLLLTKGSSWSWCFLRAKRR